MADERAAGGSGVAAIAAQGGPGTAIETTDPRRLAQALLEDAGLPGVPATMGAPDSKERWNAYAEVPARLSVLIPLPRMSLQDLLGLKPGTLLVSTWQISQDVPLLVGDVFLANVGCEPAGERLGVRINSFDQPVHQL
jgi:flagellar motor switch/type III secretory pathway protein FliN